MNVFVSPHLDDAILSCGGFIARLAERGAATRIVTLCTADAPPPDTLSELARRIHAEWELGDQPYPARRHEDAQACELLGVTWMHCGLPDAIYRQDADGRARYTSLDALIGSDPHPLDWTEQLPRIKAALQGVLHTARVVYCPLALGRHVDHALTRRAVEEVTDEDTTLIYYEDFPYAAACGDIADQPQTQGLVAIPYALTQAEIAQRVRAIACYRSQLKALFGAADRMSDRVHAYIRQVGGERYWTSVDSYRREM